MTYIWFWVHSLGEDAPKSRFTKFFRLTGGDPRAGAKYFQVTLCNSKASFKKKPKSTIQQTKLTNMTYI